MNIIHNKIALGTVQFGIDYGISNNTGKTPFDEVNKILDIARNYGINTIDTAHAYGESETVLGKCNIEKFKVITKFINIKDEKALNEQFELSLQRLKVEKVYGFLAHRPMDFCENPKLWDSLIELKEKNIIDKIGCSFNTIQEVNELKEKGIIPDIIQVPYNFFDQRFEKTMIEWKSNYNTEIHTRSTYLQGLLLMDVNKLSAFFDPIKEYLIDIELKDRGSYFLNYVINQPFIDKIVLGVNTAEQLFENLNYNFSSNLDFKKIHSTLPDDIIIPSKWKI